MRPETDVQLWLLLPALSRTDLGEFEQKNAKGETRTNWGTKEELVHAVKVAKENGVITYIDAVLNHKAGADEVSTRHWTAEGL